MPGHALAVSPALRLAEQRRSRRRPAYQNAKKNTPNAANIEFDNALSKIMLTLLKDDTQAYKQFVQNESFKRHVRDVVYQLISAQP